MDVHEIYGVLKYRMVFKLNVEIIHPYDQIKKKKKVNIFFSKFTRKHKKFNNKRFFLLRKQHKDRYYGWVMRIHRYAIHGKYR